MSSGLPCLLWVAGVVSQTHQEMHIIDSFLQGTWLIFHPWHMLVWQSKILQVHFYAHLKQLSKKSLSLCLSNLNTQNSSRVKSVSQNRLLERKSTRGTNGKGFFVVIFLDLEKTLGLKKLNIIDNITSLLLNQLLRLWSFNKGQQVLCYLQDEAVHKITHVYIPLMLGLQRLEGVSERPLLLGVTRIITLLSFTLPSEENRQNCHSRRKQGGSKINVLLQMAGSYHKVWNTI